MNVSDVLKAHMDAIRNVTTTDDKLSISDATGILKAPQTASVFLLDSSNMSANQASYQNKDGAHHFTSLVDGNNVGVYLSYPSEMSADKYVFECLVRGNLILNRLGDEGTSLIFSDVHFDEKKWKVLRIPFHCTINSAFDLYGTATKNQWLEISHPCYIKMGGN